MDFGLNETQELIRSGAADFLSDRATPEFVRSMAEDEHGYSEDFWREVGDLGWLGLLLSEDWGGAGMDMSDMAVLLGEWGAFLAPGPLIESSVVSATALQKHGTNDLQTRWLPSIASGESVAAHALIERGISDSAQALGIVASETSDGWVLNGDCRFVGYADSANLLLIPARTVSGASVFVIPTDDVVGSLSMNRLRMASGAPMFDLDLNEVELPTDSLLGDAGSGDAVLSDMMLYGATARAVQMSGAGRAVMERTLSYVKDRRQFGRAIGSFQVIQHYMADMSIKVKSAKHLADRAAWALDHVEDRDERSRLVWQAKWGANKLIPEVCWTSHQAHGAIGFTWEHDLHLYTRRVLSWRAEYGDQARHAENLASLL